MSYLNIENIEKSTAEKEFHPLLPFLPSNAKVLFLGSFPPQRKRWCMDFYYPNFINDHWRLEGQIFFGDKDYFVDKEHKTFCLSVIVEFLQEKGIGFFDAATVVRRLNDNASDKFLEILQPTDIIALLLQMPQCKVIATTGEKSAQAICQTLSIPEVPAVGHFVAVPKTPHFNREVVLYRLPSSSRAYPLSLDKKAEEYKKMFSFAGLV